MGTRGYLDTSEVPLNRHKGNDDPDFFMLKGAGVLSDIEEARARKTAKPAMTLAQVGRELNLTAERIRQIEKGALKKLRDRFGEWLR